MILLLLLAWALVLNVVLGAALWAASVELRQERTLREAAEGMANYALDQWKQSLAREQETRATKFFGRMRSNIFLHLKAAPTAEELDEWFEK